MLLLLKHNSLFKNPWWLPSTQKNKDWAQAFLDLPSKGGLFSYDHMYILLPHPAAPWLSSPFFRDSKGVSQPPPDLDHFPLSLASLWPPWGQKPALLYFWVPGMGHTWPMFISASSESFYTPRRTTSYSSLFSKDKYKACHITTIMWCVNTWKS